MRCLTTIAVAVVAATAIAALCAVGIWAVAKQWALAKRRLKGWLGELRVRIYLAICFPRSHRFYNVYLLTRHVVQVDHILVNRRGVFVLETKSWSGKVYHRGARWLQVVGRQAYEHLSPVVQSAKHAGVAARVLELDRRCVCSVVVMVGNARFWGHFPGNVVRLVQLASWIRAQPIRLSESRVTETAELLRERRLTGSWVRKKHLAGIKWRNRQRCAADVSGSWP